MLASSTFWFRVKKRKLLTVGTSLFFFLLNKVQWPGGPEKQQARTYEPGFQASQWAVGNRCFKKTQIDSTNTSIWCITSYITQLYNNYFNHKISVWCSQLHPMGIYQQISRKTEWTKRCLDYFLNWYFKDYNFH